MIQRMIKATINGTAVSVPAGTTIYDAARTVQTKVPTLCRHDDLHPTGACGMCVVKVAGVKKMPRACTTPIEDGKDITTHDGE